MLMSAASWPPPAAARSVPVDVRVDPGTSAGRSRLALGSTLTEHALDPWGNRTAVAHAKDLLRGATGLVNQHLYGWGARNPNPFPGIYDFRSLDRRVALMRELGGTPVITLCCAPDWMTARATATSKYPNLPPRPAFETAFADLARRVAKRYPDVHHYVVWNEMKGLWRRDLGRWDIERYTRLYNAVHDALKSVSPKIRVGGPYLVIEGTGSRDLGATGWATEAPLTRRDRTVIEYFLTHARGVDFLAVDRKTTSTSHDRHPYTDRQRLGLTRWFGSVTRQLRRLTRKPIWYVEDYFADSPDRALQAAGLASMLVEHVRTGASVSLRWGPQGDATDALGRTGQSLFSDTRLPGGGQPFPAYRAYRIVHEHFDRGTPLIAASSSSPDVLVVASRRRVLLVNRRAAPVRVRLGGRLVVLKRYGIRLCAYGAFPSRRRLRGTAGPRPGAGLAPAPDPPGARATARRPQCGQQAHRPAAALGRGRLRGDSRGSGDR